jgi:hypothetical protein
MDDDNSDYELDLDRQLPIYEGDIVEEGDKGGPAKNILGKRRNELSAASQKLRSAVLPNHLQGKFRTIVCRHWLTGTCMKGDSCEFLHRKDSDRMPDCLLGLKCPNKDNGRCPYKHVETEKNCGFYSQVTVNDIYQKQIVLFLCHTHISYVVFEHSPTTPP